MTKEIKAPKIYNISRFLNILNGLGLVGIAIVNIGMGNVFNVEGLNIVKDLVLSFYLFLFGIILIIISIPKSCFCRGLYTSTIFMYTAIGRIFFFLLIGTMTIVVETYGVYLMGITFANMLFNVFVVCSCKEYCLKMRLKHSRNDFLKTEEIMEKLELDIEDEKTRKKDETDDDVECGQKNPTPGRNKERAENTKNSRASSRGNSKKSRQYDIDDSDEEYSNSPKRGSSGKFKTKSTDVYSNGRGSSKSAYEDIDYRVNPRHSSEYSNSSINHNAYSNSRSSYNDLPDDWQRFYDKKTGSYYFYNSRTNETSWKQPH